MPGVFSFGDQTMQIFMTPAFSHEAAKRGYNFLLLLALMGERNQNPSWIVGRPSIKESKPDDQGRTLLVPAPFDFYVIRDDYADDDPENPGVSIITCLLCDEY